jgi:hypothetical protein
VLPAGDYEKFKARIYFEGGVLPQKQEKTISLNFHEKKKTCGREARVHFPFTTNTWNNMNITKRYCVQGTEPVAWLEGTYLEYSASKDIMIHE